MSVVRVVVLNGAGGAGKSSIAKALQAMLDEPYLHVAMDAFLDMLPGRLWDHPDGFLLEDVGGDGPPTVAIRTGPMGERLMRGMRRAVATLARAGNDLIVDDVMEAADWADYERVLAGLDVTLVGVLCPLDVLEARERARGDRRVGFARWQVERVHEGLRYDLTVDSGSASPGACAARIKTALGL